MRVSQSLARSPLILAKTLLAVGLVVCGNGTICVSAAATYPAANAAAVRVQKVQMLSSDGGEHLRPAWSPDSQWIAAGRAGMAGIDLIRRDAEEWKTLTVDPGSGYKFAWSPDGCEIAYRATLSPSNATSYVIRSVEVTTGRMVELSTPEARVFPPVWVRSNANQRVSFMVGTNRVKAPWAGMRGKATPTPTRNEDRILYSEQGQVWSHGPGTVCSQLTDTGGMEPVWSPDRSKIVYSQMGTLTIMEPDGSNKRVLVQGHHPSWSPDGNMLVYGVSLDDGHRILTSDLYVINSDGTQPTRLTDTPELLECEPAWSPDGKCIACRAEDSGRVLLLWLE